MTTLAPLYTEIGLSPDHAGNQKITGIKLSEHYLSLSADDFTILDSRGQVVGQCRGKLLSVRGKKEMTDADGKVIYRIQHVTTLASSLFRATPPGYIVSDEDGNEVLTVAAPFSGKVKLIARFKNCHDNTDTVINIVKLSHVEARMILGEDGPVLGMIRRHGGYLKDLVQCAQTYTVDMAPGLDWTLAAALTICYDHTRPYPLFVPAVVAT